MSYDPNKMFPGVSQNYVYDWDGTAQSTQPFRNKSGLRGLSDGLDNQLAMTNANYTPRVAKPKECTPCKMVAVAAGIGALWYFMKKRK
jgi:hypothetical protein